MHIDSRGNVRRSAPCIAGRAVDVVGAATGLLLSAPFLLVIAVAVRRQLGRPVFFRQQRVGRDGVPFTILKFRTMRNPVFEGQPDRDRTPSMGRVLRTCSLDELPQLWNVLVGQMSLIGPRPTLPEQVVHYSPEQHRRHEVRPGITGYAQVKGRNELSWPERIALDVWYIDNRTVWLDLWILAMTVYRLLRPRGITGTGGTNPQFPVPREGREGTVSIASTAAAARSGERARGEHDGRKVPHVVD